MARKVFVLLWMTVWPVVALFPTLVTGQVARNPQPDGVRTTPVTVAEKPPAPPEAISAVSERLPEPPETEPVQVSVSAPPPDETLQPRSLQVVAPPPPSRPVASTDEKRNFFEEDPVEEPLPPAQEQVPTPVPVPPPAIEQAPTPEPATAQPTPSATPEPATGTRPTRRTAPALTAQQEHAQKLIHERALLKGLQRQTRLEMKYRGLSNAPAGTAARWQLQLAQPNWVAGSHPRKP